MDETVALNLLRWRERLESLRSMDFPALELWRRLPRDTTRDEYFRVLRDAVQQFYLADPANPYQQSGRSSGSERWEETRRIITKAVHRSGDFMDVGCANGLLLQTVIDWARQDGFAIRPYGIDLVPELIELARLRLPGHDDHFEVANAYYWEPKRQYDFVRTNLEYVPERDWVTFIRRQYAAVSIDGRLVLCHYRNAGERLVDVARVAEQAGYGVTGTAEAPGVEVAWIQRNA